MRGKQTRTGSSSGSDSTSDAASPGRRSLTDAIRLRAKAPATDADPGATFSRATSGGGSEVPFRGEMERAFGQDFSGVRSHTGQRAEMDSLGAHAATNGEKIAFGSSAPDKQTVAHELTHVVQHRLGTTGVHGKGGITPAGDSSEVEADRVADKVVAGEQVQVGGGGSDGLQLARKTWQERQADLLVAIDERIAALTPAATTVAVAPKPEAAKAEGAEVAPKVDAAPKAEEPKPDAAPAKAAPPDPKVVTIAELQSLRAAVAAASDDASMDLATANGVTLFSTKKDDERQRFDGWVRAFGGVEGGGEMDTFLTMTDGQAASIAADFSVGGLAQQMLMQTFEMNWFKAKECLVFWRWPKGEPKFSRATGLDLMTALTKLRGAVHAEAQTLTQAAINGEVKKTADKQKATKPELAATLKKESAPPGPGGAQPQHVEFKGSVGADTVTSDVDVSTGGVNTEIAVRVYNEQFRALMKTAFDPGTVFDLNVYSKDFIFKPDIVKGEEGQNAKITPGVEHPDAEPSAEETKAQDEEQDIFALVHIARYMPNKGEWDAYAAKVIEGISNPTEKKRQRGLMIKAWDRVDVFNTKIAFAMDQLKSEVDKGIEKLGESSWKGDEQEHFDEGALKMRAANKIYEAELIKVKEIRAQIEACGPTEQEKKGRLAAELTTAISAAQLFANEVYGSRGGTVHAVIAVQTARKKAVEFGKNVDVIMPPALWHETFNDNLGDVLKDYAHYGHASGEHAADFGYAAFKMGKYADRMVDAVPHLTEGGAGAYLGANDLAAIQGSAEYVDLTELSKKHVIAKNGPASNNPALLANDDYFNKYDAGKLAALKDKAITLGASVRGKVAQHRSTPAPDAAAGPEGAALVPDADAALAPAQAGPDAAPQAAPPAKDPRPVLGAMAGTVKALIAKAEEASKAGPAKTQ